MFGGIAVSDYFNSMDSQQLDVFREIGNIGAGNAVTALATMLNKTIDMSIPDVQIVPFNEIVNILKGPETLVVGQLVDLTGDLTGYILLILGVEDAYEMVSVALGTKYDIPENPQSLDLDEVGMSALTEMANILVGSYLSAICTLTNLNVTPSIPYMAVDMVGAIISIVAIEYGKVGDSVLFLKTQFSDIETDMAGHFFLLPDLESYKVLMKSLGIEP